MKSKFIDLQEDKCQKVEDPPDISDFCPTCVPDESYIAPNWWETKQPYLNKKTCEYSTIASVTVDGDIFTHSSISASGKSFSNVLNSYKRTGLNFMLNYFNKEKVTEINGRPIEDYVKASDYHFYSFADSAMVVLITIPAVVFDNIPEMPTIDSSIDDLTSQLVLEIKTADLFPWLIELKSAISVYSKFQAMHYQFSGDKHVFERGDDPFYLKFYSSRIENFMDLLEKLIERNGFEFGLFANPLKTAYKLEISFEQSEEKGTFKITNIRAKRRLQRFKKLKKGLNFFKKKFNKDPTLLAFVNNIVTIHLRLTARRTPSWEDFMNDFVFPKVVVQSKKASAFTTGIPKLNTYLSGLDDIVFDGLVSFSDAFRYNLNQSNKTNLRKLNEMPQSFDEYDFKLGEISFKFANDRKKKKTKLDFCLADAIAKWTNDGEDYLKEMLTRLNPCKLKELASTALLCIVGNVELETAFLAVIKTTFKNLTSEGLQILLAGLPPEKQALIEKEVNLLLKGTPKPWTAEYSTITESDFATVGNYLADLPSSSLTGSVGDEFTFDIEPNLSPLRILKETEIFKIYEEVIMRVAEISDIMEALEDLPGIKLLTKFLGQSRFPTTHFIQPPIDSWMNSLTFDICGKEFGKLSLPEIYFLVEFSGWDWLKEMGKAFILALKLTIKQIIQALLAKLASKISVELPTIGDLFCQGLSLNNKNPVADLLTGRGDLGDIMSDAIGIEGGSAEKDKAVDAIMKATGIVDNKSKELSDNAQFPNVDTDRGFSTNTGFDAPNYDPFRRNEEQPPDNIDKSSMPFIELAKAISVSSTKNEIIRAITLPEEEQNREYFTNMANTLPHAVPAFAEALNSEEKVMKFFMQMGSKLTPDQRAFLQDQISPSGDREPLEETICLNQNEFQQWMDDRERAFADSGLNPDIAKEFVEKQNDRIKSDLDDLLEIFANGPDTLLQNAIDNALSSDPCENPNALVTTQNTPAERILTDVVSSMFKRLESAFIDDTIEWNFFERLVDSPGILSLILADKKGFTLNYHNSVNDSAILRFFLPNPGEEPTTVSIQMLKFINKSNFKMSNNVVKLNYSNELDDNNKFESVVKYMEEENSFNYKVRVNSPTLTLFAQAIQNKSSQPEQPISARPIRIGTKNDALSILLKNRWNGFDGINFNNQSVKHFNESINNILFSNLAKEIMKDSPGFVYSALTQEITKEDLEYVAPDGGEYDFEEDEAVLGRSATGNERVVFLDPSENGGSYRRPKYYIKPQEQEGWKKIAKIFIPNSEQKGDPLTFLHIPDIAKSVSKTMNSLVADERLHLSPDELIEVPFDKVSSASTIGGLEGCVISSIRLFLADFFIRAAPVITNVALGDDNYDDLLAASIVSIMKDEMVSQTSTKSSIYSGYVYWLLFLEQATQVFDRKYKKELEILDKHRSRGLTEKQIKKEQELMKYNSSLIFARSAQNNFVGDDGSIFEFLKKEEAWSLNSSSYLTSLEVEQEKLEDAISNRENAIENSELGNSQNFREKLIELKDELLLNKEMQNLHAAKKKFGDNVLRGSLIIGYGKDYWKFLNIKKSEWKDSIIPIPADRTDKQYGFTSNYVFDTKFNEISLWDANFASKIFSISTVESECEKMLKYLIKEQIRYYAPFFKDSINPKVHNINRFLFGSSKIFKHMPSIGTKDETFENIRGCVANPQKQNPLDGIHFSKDEISQISKNGYFFFEKYLRITEKEGSPFINRNDTLKGVVNPKHFMKYLKENRSLIDEELPISEFFGNPQIATETVVGSIGIKFGIRLCYVPPRSFIKIESSQKNLKKAMKEKSFIFKSAVVEDTPIPESKHIFPVCSFEQDLLDQPMSYYLNSLGEDFNQDIDCYVDNLFKSNQFDLLFNKIINVKKIPSIMSVYSYTNFLNALGVDGSEREDSDESDLNSNNLAQVFNDSKKELKKMFINYYTRNDFEPEDDNIQDDQDVQEKNKKLSSTLDHVVMSKEIPWFAKLSKVAENPFIKNVLGQNRFQKLVKLNFDLIASQRSR